MGYVVGDSFGFVVDVFVVFVGGKYVFCRYCGVVVVGFGLWWCIGGFDELDDEGGVVGCGDCYCVVCGGI